MKQDNQTNGGLLIAIAIFAVVVFFVLVKSANADSLACHINGGAFYFTEIDKKITILVSEVYGFGAAQGRDKILIVGVLDISNFWLVFHDRTQFVFRDTHDCLFIREAKGQYARLKWYIEQQQHGRTFTEEER